MFCSIKKRSTHHYTAVNGTKRRTPEWNGLSHSNGRTQRQSSLVTQTLHPRDILGRKCARTIRADYNHRRPVQHRLHHNPLAVLREVVELDFSRQNLSRQRIVTKTRAGAIRAMDLGSTSNNKTAVFILGATKASHDSLPFLSSLSSSATLTSQRGRSHPPYAANKGRHIPSIERMHLRRGVIA